VLRALGAKSIEFDAPHAEWDVHYETPENYSPALPMYIVEATETFIAHESSWKELAQVH
jgi:hypothetical protein